MAGWGAIFLAHIGKRLAGLETPFSIAPYLTVRNSFKIIVVINVFARFSNFLLCLWSLEAGPVACLQFSSKCCALGMLGTWMGFEQNDSSRR